MRNIFIGNTQVEGNLSVVGTQFVTDVETIISHDGIITVNEPPVSGANMGLLGVRSLNDFSPVASGIILAAGPTSATLDYAFPEPNWIIVVGSEQKKILTAVGPNITISAPWSILPGAPYSLYKDTGAGFFYKPATEKFYAGYTDALPQINPGTLVVSRLEQTFGENVWYVGKHGNDTFSGRTIAEARLTFGAVPTAATIICLDDGSYAETVVCTGKIYAPNAHVNGLQISSAYVQLKSFGAATGTGTLVFDSGGTITCASGVLNICGRELTGMTGIICAGEIYGRVELIFSLTAINASGIVYLSGSKIFSTTTAIGGGDIRLFYAEIVDPLPLGITIPQIANHIASTANPHSVTFAQVSPLGGKGELISHDGAAADILPPGLDGQILTADSVSPLGLKWSAPSIAYSFSLHPEKTLVSSNVFATIAYLTWVHANFSAFGPGKLIFFLSAAGEIKLTNGVTDFYTGILAGGYHAVNITNPSADCVMLLQVRKSSGNFSIEGVSLVF